MKTQQILKLLNEASITTDGHALAKIQCQLTQATAAFNGEFYDIDTPEEGILLLLDTLFVKLWRESPQLLPAMLPVFDLMCGDRDKDSILKTQTD